MVNLDKLDRRILFELDRNSRQSVTSLARKVRQGRDRVEYRLARLMDRGIVAKCVAEIDLCKLGYSLFKTYLRLENNRQRVQEFVAFLTKHPRADWMAQCDGSWDLILILVARNAREFYDIHSEILSKFNDVVLNFAAYTLVEYKLYTRNYLHPNPRAFLRYGSALEHAAIDSVDRDILYLLGQNARTPTSMIAQQIGRSVPFTAFRIQRLEDLGVVVGYRVDLNLEALEMVMFKAQFFLRNYELSLRERFIDYCLHHPNIVFYIEQIGDCNIEIELEVSNYQEYARVIDEIRSEFAKLIRNFSTMLIRRSWHSPISANLPVLGLES